MVKIKDLLTGETLQGQTALVVDSTGVGAPVVDLPQQARLQPVRVVIHGGGQLIFDEKSQSWRVPKRELISTTKVLSQ